MYDKAYFTNVHLLVHYTSVNIPLMHGYRIYDVQKCCKDKYEDHLLALHSFVIDYLTPLGIAPSDMLIVGQFLESVYTFHGNQHIIIASQEPATASYSEPN
jgi:hypothetical protein